MSASPTPIGLLEQYFQTPLTRSALSRFDEVDEETWIDFAKQYLANMQHDFPSSFLESAGDEHSVRYFFEPQLSMAWDTAIERQQYARTPLLSHSPYLRDGVVLTEQEVSRLLDPLKKHLLLADSLYLRDNFYYGFDAMADSYQRDVWRDDPNVADGVRRSIRHIKSWLPILADLRPFIESRALVFMPYYLTPSFPYDAGSPRLEEARARLRWRAGTPDADESVGEDDALTAWLNARMLGLDPVFPTRAMFNWASGLYFQDGDSASDTMSDMLTIDVLPFDTKKAIDLETLWKIRRDEAVFQEVRTASAGCKTMLAENLRDTATPEAASLLCRQFLDDHLLRTKGEAALRKLETPAAGLGLSLAVSIGVSLLTANPVVGIVAGTALNPSLVHLVKQKLSRTDRAVGLLQALL